MNSTSHREAPTAFTPSAQVSSLPAPDNGGSHSADPRAAHPPAQQTVQTVTKLPPGPPMEVSAAPGGHFADHPPTPVSVDALQANQCHFPIWPHMALPSHRHYGVMCGGPVAPDPNDTARHAPRYCAHHVALCTRPKREVA